MFIEVTLRACIRSSACIGTRNRRGSPSPVLRTPSPPLGERGYGSWRAPTALLPCIRSMNRSESPSPFLRTPSPPVGERDGVRGCLGSWKAPTTFVLCIGTLDPTKSPSTALRAPSPPLEEKEGMREFGSWTAAGGESAAVARGRRGVPHCPCDATRHLQPA